MKKVLLTFIFIIAAASAYAQPRAIGLRLGFGGLEASYQHSMNNSQFIEGDLALDFGFTPGYTINQAGIKVTGIYNFIWARPAWTNQGSWTLYAGPGITLGHVGDEVHFRASDGKNIDYFYDTGFMIGFCGQVGLEYSFWFPLQLSVDLRPVIGLHANNGYEYIDPINPDVRYNTGSRTGFYDNGLLGFCPTISVRYLF